MGRRLPAGRVMRMLAIAPLLLAGLLAGAGQAAATVAETCSNGAGGQPPGPSGGAIFAGVTVVTACDVWTVGSQFPGSAVSSTLIEHWTGGPSWTVVASPSPSADSQLTAVRAVSATDIWAVGWYKDSSGLRLTLTEHWDGSAWTQKQSPSPGVRKGSILEGVTATSATSAWAVGRYDDQARGKIATLILRWDGSAWTQADSPSPGGFNALSAVSATSATNAWAVGSFDRGDGTGRHPLTEHWDGSAWTQVDSPSPPGSSSLQAVAVTASNNAWAVGSSVDSDGHFHALIERWNGSAWTQAPIPAEASSLDLIGVAATSAGNAWAIADNGLADTVLHWDGSAWTLAKAPALGDSVLLGVGTTPVGFVWAVGYATRLVAVRLQDVPRIQVVVQGSDAHVYKTGPVEGLASTGVNLAAGTSPAAAGDGHGGVESAWQAAGTHHLFTLDPSGHQADTGLSVAAGTSPAVAALPGGGFQIAFVSAADGQVWVLGPGGAPARAAAPGLAVAAGTSPSIASNSAGAVRVAVHAAGSDHLWLIGTTAGGTAREIGVSLAAGTSPAIAAGPTGFTAAFVHAGDGTLWQLRRDGSASQAAAGWRSRRAPARRSPPTAAPGSSWPSAPRPTASCGWSAATAACATPVCRCWRAPARPSPPPAATSKPTSRPPRGTWSRSRSPGQG